MGEWYSEPYSEGKEMKFHINGKFCAMTGDIEHPRNPAKCMVSKTKRNRELKNFPFQRTRNVLVRRVVGTLSPDAKDNQFNKKSDVT